MHCFQIETVLTTKRLRTAVSNVSLTSHLLEIKGFGTQ